MPVVEHGTAGTTIGTAADRYGAAARRGGFFERQVGAALRDWLSRRPDQLHLFHDLQRLRQVRGAGADSLDLGEANIDHVVLSGEGWLMIDAKGCGAGVLGVDEAGRGVLVRADGSAQPQPWMDHARFYSLAGALFRLTSGKRGHPVWVVPDDTRYDQSIGNAAFLRRGGTIANIGEIRAGALDPRLPAPQAVAEPGDVARLLSHLCVASPLT
ncbi:MAG: nuclease-related domain-containing protein [Micromonosporaceae bacterium]